MEQKIIESNSLIAEFMEAIPEQWYPESKMYKQSGKHYSFPRSTEYPDNKRFHSDNLLKYHTDWNWLMQVVEKIETLYDNNDGKYGVYISSNCCNIQGTNLAKALIPDSLYKNVYFDQVYTEKKIESVYNAVVNFINYYNKREA